MKTRFIKYSGLAIVGVIACGALFSGVQVEESSFEARRAAMPVKLAALRARTDEAGGKDLSLALLLGSKSKDARLVGSTVLVYQEYPKERKLAVLLAAAVRYSERLEVLQRVKDQTLTNALLQAPPEMEGINGMFQTVDELNALLPAQFKKAVDSARASVLGPEYTRQAVPQALKARSQQTSQADRN